MQIYIVNLFQADLSDQRHEQESQSRTSGEKCRLYTIRVLVNFIIIALLIGAGAAIYFAQDFSSSVSHPIVRLYPCKLPFGSQQPLLSKKSLLFKI